MNLEKIREEWAKDSVIDKIDMDKASLETPKLHSKYSLIKGNVLSSICLPISQSSLLNLKGIV